MAHENKFLTIPSQEGLFAVVRKERIAEMGEDDEDDNGDEEEEVDVRLIPRCSPVPRKRGHSLTDETAEYMRIRLALPRRRVSFADASGGELVDVRQFVPFDSDDEEDDDARWKEEEAKYRKAYRQPTYRVRPDFEPLSDVNLAHTVRANKVEVEGVRAVPGESLSFDGLIRVLNVSFHKVVYVRATMDGWITYFDYPAEYVDGSHDSETDGFCVRLSFSEPYLFDGARIDFVVRYETADGEFWANNEGKNYSVTLQVSYEEEAGQASKVEDVELRGILKPSRYGMDYDYDFSQDKEEGDEAGTEREAAVVAPSAVCPLVIEPEIDIEVVEDMLVSPPNTRVDPTSAEGSLPCVEDSSDEHPLQDPAAIPPQTDHPETVGQSTVSLLPPENLTVSITKLKETQLEVPENSPSDEADTEVSSKPDKVFSPSQDDPQSEISVQVPFDSDTTSSAMYPSIQHAREEESEELKEEGEPEEETKLETETPMQDQAVDRMEVDETEGSLQVLQESVWQGSVLQISDGSPSQEAKMPGSVSPSVEEPEMYTAKYDATVRSETSRENEAGLTVEGVQAGGEEVPGIMPTSAWNPLGATHLGPTGDDMVTQSLPLAPDPEVSIHQQQRHGQRSELNLLPAVLCMDTDSPSASDRTSFKDGDPIPTSIFKTGTNVKAASPEAKDRESCSREDEPVTRKELEEECEPFHDEPVPPQTQKNLESQLPLPGKILEVPSAEPEAVLGQTLFPSIAVLCVAVVLVVGFQEPSVFLVLGLFLVSLRL
ncbi:hypothetical protein NFI96_020946 [Prochilodus magdalenae]|nr:hypothetical protein NFI96_020946 [Prochilodus magdalenae]